MISRIGSTRLLVLMLFLMDGGALLATPTILRSYVSNAFRVIVVKLDDGSEAFYWSRPGDGFFERIPTQPVESIMKDPRAYTVPVSPVRAKGKKLSAGTLVEEIGKPGILSLFKGNPGVSLDIKLGDIGIRFHPEPKLSAVLNEGLHNGTVSLNEVPTKREIIMSLQSKEQGDLYIVSKVEMPDIEVPRYQVTCYGKGKSWTKWAKYGLSLPSHQHHFIMDDGSRIMFQWDDESVELNRHGGNLAHRAAFEAQPGATLDELALIKKDNRDGKALQDLAYDAKGGECGILSALKSHLNHK